jgi:hypothetical protein
MPNGKRSFPGRLTLEEWRGLSFWQRRPRVQRAQADLLGSFRFCADKRCRRIRACCSDEPSDRHRRLRSLRKSDPKTLRREWARLDKLAAL